MKRIIKGIIEERNHNGGPCLEYIKQILPDIKCDSCWKWNRKSENGQPDSSLKRDIKLTHSVYLSRINKNRRWTKKNEKKSKTWVQFFKFQAEQVFKSFLSQPYTNEYELFKFI